LIIVLKSLKTFTKILLVGLLLAMAAVVFVLILPFYMIVLPLSVRNNKKERAAYLDFLDKQSNSIFLVYTSNRKTRGFMEACILPQLNTEIKIVFLEGKRPHTDMEVRFVRKLLNDQKVKGGFPWLMKITDGKVHVTSINNAVYNAMRDSDTQALLFMINSHCPGYKNAVT
jgi:hypothetical protein